jgi:ketosteroid isomerase-like protein
MRAPILSAFIILFLAGLFPAGSSSAEEDAVPSPEEELRTTEIAFARTMADRDLEAFASFLDEETVFFGKDGPLRGRKAVVEAWSRFFEGPDAPFSWEPDAVAVLASGGLGLTSGPVHDPAGERVGTFNSVWRRTDAGWRIVFDKGCP